MEKQDRRSRRSEKLLQQALVEPLSTKELKNISVREVAEVADVHRSTFYTHYEDIYQLYAQIVQKFCNDITDIVDKDYKGNTSECYRILLEYAYENKQLSSILLKRESASSIFGEALKIMKKSCKDYWCKVLGVQELTDDMQYYIDYHVVGCFAIVRDLCDNDFALPVDKAAQMITDVDENMTRFMAKQVK